MTTRKEFEQAEDKPSAGDNFPWNAMYKGNDTETQMKNVVFLLGHIAELLLEIRNEQRK